MLRACKTKEECGNRGKKLIYLIMFLSENVDEIMMFVEWCGLLIDFVCGWGNEQVFVEGGVKCQLI